MKLLRQIRDNKLESIDFKELQNYKEFVSISTILKKLVDTNQCIHSAVQDIENVRSELIEIMNIKQNQDIAPFVNTEYKKMFQERL